MPDPVPGNPAAQVAMVQSVAGYRAATRNYLAADEAFVIMTLAQIDSMETQYIAAARQSAEAQMSVYQYTLAFGTGTTRYQAAIEQADAEGNAISRIAASQVGEIRQTSAAEVSATAGVSAAQLEEATRTAAIDASATASQAAIQATATTSLATIGATRTTQIASIESTFTTTSATIDQTQGIALANIEATEAGETAAIRVSEILQSATIRSRQYASDASIQVTLTESLAGIQANETTVAAGYQVDEIREETAQRIRGQEESAEIRSGERITEAELRALIDIERAKIRYANERYAADDRLAAVEYRADKELEATEFEATQSADLVEYRATESYQGDVKAADADLRGTQYSADGEYTRRTQAAITEAAAREFAADRDYEGVVYQQATQDRILAARLANVQAKWNLLANGPWPQSQQPRIPPGVGLPLPVIPLRPVLTPSQIQQSVNAGYARAEIEQASGLREAQQDAAGRGFSPASPAIFLERIRLASARYRSYAQAALDPSLDVANAEQLTRLQQLRSQLFLGQQQDYVDAESDQVKREVGVLDDMTQIAGGI